MGCFGQPLPRDKFKPPVILLSGKWGRLSVVIVLLLAVCIQSGHPESRQLHTLPKALSTTESSLCFSPVFIHSGYSGIRPPHSVSAEYTATGNALCSSAITAHSEFPETMGLYTQPVVYSLVRIFPCHMVVSTYSGFAVSRVLYPRCMDSLTGISAHHTKQLLQKLLSDGDVESNPGPKRQQTLSQSNHGDVVCTEPCLSDILRELKDCRMELNGKIDTLGKSMDAKYEELITENKALKEELVDMKHKLVDIEDRSRRNNLVLTGISERERENWDDTEKKMVTEIGRNLGIDLQDEDIERAHRIGRFERGKSRPVVARFTSYKTKEKVLKAARQKKVEGFYINEDFSEETRQKRKQLTKLLKEKRSQGMTVFLRYNKLVVRNTEGKENWYEDRYGDICMTKQGFNDTKTQRSYTT